MKIRNGFVSNSSSSSFVIFLDNITTTQLKMIENHGDSDSDYDDKWVIDSDGSTVRGHTWMDNFDMRSFLTNVVGVSEELISWGE